MTEKQKQDAESGASSLVEGFHRVSSLVPDHQELTKVTKDTTVAEALAIMQKHHFSQLPVMAGSAVLGVFSYRSFCAKAPAKQKSSRSEWLGGLPVEEFLEAPQYVPPNEDWTNIQRHLYEQDAFFVGHPDRVTGLVTTMDVYQYFRSIADPFILVAEIEMALRRIIAISIPKEERKEVFEGCLAGAYGTGHVPKHLTGLTLNDYFQIISTRDNWSYFDQLFGSSDKARSSTVTKLKPIPGWRNDTFHFRRRLEEHELKKLAECRNWLHRSVRAFEGHKREAERQAKKSTPTKPRKGKTSRNEFLVACEPEAAEFFAWMLDKAIAHNFIIYWGSKGFSIRTKLPSRMVSIAYGYPDPDELHLYFRFGPLAPENSAGLRWQFLDDYSFREGGKYTLKCEINGGTRDDAKDAFQRIVTYWEQNV